MSCCDFLVIGAQKGGTTTLDAFLCQHPQLHVPDRKELNFFALRGEMPSWRGPGDEVAVAGSVYDPGAYAALFADAPEGALKGEASVLYLYDPEAPAAIHAANPRMKLIAVLRNPVDRAYSAYGHLRRDGRETVEDFNEALALEERRKEEGYECLWHYRSVGFYGRQLERYYGLFPAEQLLVLDMRDVLRDQKGTARKVFQFLGVDTDVTIDTTLEMNASGLPKSQWLNNFLNRPHPFKPLLKRVLPMTWARRLKGRIQRRNLAKLPALSPATRAEVLAGYHDDLRLVAELTGLDLLS
jgi:hypothetical protein